MLLRGSIAAIAFAAAVVNGTPVAFADEAFLCGTDRVVYVKPGELEELKRTDPCIAGYFGLTVNPPLPAKSAPGDAANAPSLDFKKTLGGPEDQANAARPGPWRVAQAGVTAKHRAPPVASPGTDFRNVRLINAEPGSDNWYRHEQ